MFGLSTIKLAAYAAAAVAIIGALTVLHHSIYASGEAAAKAADAKVYGPQIASLTAERDSLRTANDGFERALLQYKDAGRAQEAAIAAAQAAQHKAQQATAAALAKAQATAEADATQIASLSALAASTALGTPHECTDADAILVDTLGRLRQPAVSTAH